MTSKYKIWGWNAVKVLFLMHSKLCCFQLIITKIFYVSFMVTTKQKSTDTPKMFKNIKIQGFKAPLEKIITKSGE